MGGNTMLAEKLITGDKFKFESHVRGEKKVVILKGSIDEDVNFDPIKRLGGPFIFNFRELTSINSCGIRGWVNFLKELGRIQIFYEECPPLIVRQMNMVPSFLGHAQVLSVYIPYVCDKCESEKLVLMESDKLEDPSANIEATISCESCGKGEMEFDGHPQQYFAFAK
jgi:hypothetical protein